MHLCSLRENVEENTRYVATNIQMSYATLTVIYRRRLRKTRSWKASGETSWDWNADSNPW